MKELTSTSLRQQAADVIRASILAGENATQDQIVGIRQTLGLDQPLISQFKTWIAHMASGDFGQSYYFKVPVTDLLIEAAWPTITPGPPSVCSSSRNGQCVRSMIVPYLSWGRTLATLIFGLRVSKYRST